MQRHRRLQAVEERLALGAGDRRSISPPVADLRPHMPRRSSTRRQLEQRARVDRRLQRRRAARGAARRGARAATARRRTARACVISCSATQRQELLERRRRAVARPRARFGVDEQQPRARWSGSSRASSYWPSTRRARKPTIAADLGREQHAARGAQRPGERAQPAPPSCCDDRVEQRRASRCRLACDPRRAGRPPRAAGSGRRRARVRCRRRRAARRPAPARRGRPGSGCAARRWAEPATARATLLGEAPVDHRQ